MYTDCRDYKINVLLLMLSTLARGVPNLIFFFKFESSQEFSIKSQEKFAKESIDEFWEVLSVRISG